MRIRNEQTNMDNFVNAARNGKLKILLSALKTGINIDARGGNNNATAIIEAQHHSNIKAVRLLIKNGLKVHNHRDGFLPVCDDTYNDDYIPNGKAILHTMDYDENEKLIRYIINNGKSVDINIKDDQGNTPLLIALDMEKNICSFSLFKFLIDKGPNVNTLNDDNETPLKMICDNETYDQLKRIKYIVKRGANVTIESLLNDQDDIKRYLGAILIQRKFRSINKMIFLPRKPWLTRIQKKSTL
jgi:ankyrin repeat protein